MRNKDLLCLQTCMWTHKNTHLLSCNNLCLNYNNVASQVQEGLKKALAHYVLTNNWTEFYWLYASLSAMA